LKPTLNKYILFEILPTLLVSLPLFVIIIMVTRMRTITEWIIVHRIHPVQIIKLIFFLTPEIVLFVLPASLLMAVVFTFIRMSSDNEIVALQTSGITLFQVLLPVIAVSVITAVFGFFISIFAVPYGNKSFKNLTFEIIEKKADLGIKERMFCEPFEDVVFYISSVVPKERVMKDVFVVDKRQNAEMINSIVAKEAKFFFDPKARNVNIQFIDGVILMTERDLGAARSIKFSKYNLIIDLKRMFFLLFR